MSDYGYGPEAEIRDDNRSLLPYRLPHPDDPERPSRSDEADRDPEP